MRFSDRWRQCKQTCRSIGYMYTNGKGIPQNYKTALKWFTLAAEQGHAVSQDFMNAITPWWKFWAFMDGGGFGKNHVSTNVDKTSARFLAKTAKLKKTPDHYMLIYHNVVL